MDSHPIDPVALISGLFFALAGASIFADQRWEDVDVTAFTAAGVMLLGLVLAGVAIVRLISARSAEPAYMSATPTTEPPPAASSFQDDSTAPLAFPSDEAPEFGDDVDEI